MDQWLTNFKSFTMNAQNLNIGVNASLEAESSQTEESSMDIHSFFVWHSALEDR